MTAAERQRVQKLLASLGLGSRRSIEDWLRNGRISINGVTAKLGDRASLTDQILLDGKALKLDGQAQSAVLIYHKPLGEVTTRSDPAGRPTVFERLPAPPSGRWVVVGRLDVNTTGLLLFTNDGELAHRLMHPSFGNERRYLVRVRGVPDAQAIDRLQSGVQLEDGPAKFDQIESRGQSEGHATFQVSLGEGRNREVRRLFEAVGFEVSRLKRLGYGAIDLPEDLPVGQSRSLSPALIQRLQRNSPSTGSMP